MKRFLPKLILLIFTLVAIKTYAQTNVSGNITTNTTWTKANSPYILTGNVGVPTAYKLTIEPGVTVQRSDNYQILINGSVTINGTAADSIAFVSYGNIGGTADPYGIGNGAYFLEFQKSNLNNSSLQYVAFRNQSSNNNNIRLGNEDEFAQTSPKNSGTLTVSKSNLSYGATVTKGYNAANGLNIDNSLLISANIYGYYPSSEKINITNSAIYNSSVTSDAYNKGISFTTCTIKNTALRVGCCGANLNFISSNVEDCTIKDGAAEVSVSNSIFLNTPINISGSVCNITNSKFIATKPIDNSILLHGVSELHSEYLIIAGNINITNSEILNASGTQLSGIYIYGYTNNSSSGSNAITGNTFTNLNNVLYVAVLGTITPNNNSFINTGSYYIQNYSLKNFSALNNYFGPKAGKTIDDMIFDSNDDLTYGLVTYTTAPNPPNNITLSPANAFKSVSGSNVLVTWDKSTAGNIKNYKVYWGNGGANTYINSALVAPTENSYLISGASITDSIAVTALNTSSTGTNDILNGNESWYAYARYKKPVITSFSPTAAGAGATVTITGTDLLSPSSVSFGGKSAASYTAVSPTSITAVVNTGTPSGDVSIVTAGGTAVLSGFTFIPAPTISNIAPATTGAGATVTITGTNFTGATAVTFGGVPATSFTVVSATSITAVVGAGASGTVSVTTPGGVVNQTGFVFVPAPTVSTFAPAAAGTGTTVTITGTNFTNVSTVSIGGVPATSFNVVSSTSITAIVGASASSGNISITTLGGQVSTAGFIYIPAPAIASFSPISAATGDVVTITGTNFTGASAVGFGGVQATSFTVVSPTSITAVVAGGSSGSVSVITPGGTNTKAGFTYIYPVPTIASFTPASAILGATVTISGTNFTSASAVSFGGVQAASFTVISPTTITARVGSSGATGNIAVTTSGGTATSATGFTYLPIPAITSFSPTTAKAGSTITITGANFTGATGVSIGGVPVASFTVVSATSITAVVGAGNTGFVSVTNANGTASLGNFTYVSVPVITGPASPEIALGNIASLSTIYNAAYQYQWYRDGVALSGSGNNYLANFTGAYTVSVTLNGVTQTSLPFYVHAVLPASNYRISAVSASCKGAANGSINITTTQSFGYTASVSRNGTLLSMSSFTSQLNLPNLSAGTYDVCISVTNYNYQECFTVVVTEPKDIALYTAVNKTNNSVDMTLTGADIYNVTLNGVKYTNTSGFLSLPLNKGKNDIMVSTDKECQGVIEKHINIADDIIAYPNPFTNGLTLNLTGKAISKLSAEVVNSFGKVVYTKQFTDAASEIYLDLSGLAPSQVYVLKLTADNTEYINKIIKK